MNLQGFKSFYLLKAVTEGAVLLVLVLLLPLHPHFLLVNFLNKFS
jgi:hypothetical protein